MSTHTHQHTRPEQPPAPAKAKTRSRWRRFERRGTIAIGVIALVLVAARIALPFVIESYVNKRLAMLPDYRGKIGDVDVALWRGAYTIRDIQILKANGEIPTPFFSAEEIDLSVQWKELFHGAIVGEVHFQKPAITFVAGPTKEQSQTGIDQGWAKTLESLFPFQINHVDLKDGNVRFQDLHADPKVDIFAYDLAAFATNLTNVRNLTNALPSAFAAHGKIWGEGRVQVHLQIDALAERPTFAVAAALTNIDLVALNDFMRAYAGVDVEQGTLSVYTEIQAQGGKYEGYVKPLFQNLNVFEWKKDRKENFVQAFWEAIAGTVAGAFKNQPRDQLATRIPITGTFDQPQVDIFATIGNVLRNAFVRALAPRFDRTLRLADPAEADFEKKPKP